jgi:hypothetical protein
MANDKKYKFAKELVIGDYVISEPNGFKAKIIGWKEKPYWAHIRFLNGGTDTQHTSHLTYAPWLAKKKKTTKRKK